MDVKKIVKIGLIVCIFIVLIIDFRAFVFVALQIGISLYVLYYFDEVKEKDKQKKNIEEFQAEYEEEIKAEKEKAAKEKAAKEEAAKEEAARKRRILAEECIESNGNTNNMEDKSVLTVKDASTISQKTKRTFDWERFAIACNAYVERKERAEKNDGWY